MTKEIWRPVEGWGNKYEVSSKGRVRRTWDKSLVAQHLGKEGLLYVNIYNKNVSGKRRIHVMVANAFIPNPDGLPCVEHIDGDKLNNNVENLRWQLWVMENHMPEIPDERFKPVPSVPGLECTYDGEFRLYGRRKIPTKNTNKDGFRATSYIRMIINGKLHRYAAARCVAETWLPDYTEDSYITYNDGNIHNVAADNLHICDEEDFNDYKARNGGFQPMPIEDRKRLLQRVSDEALMTMRYFETLDMSEINRHVKEFLYPTIYHYCIYTLRLGEQTSRIQSAEAIARLYEFIMNGRCMFYYERFCRQLLKSYKRIGHFGFAGQVPKPILFQVQQLKLDSLCEKFKVTSLHKNKSTQGAA